MAHEPTPLNELSNTYDHVDTREFDHYVRQMRSFFGDKMGFKEPYAQNRLSILAACEDPQTVSTFMYRNNGELEVWSLPQTSQMWLEDILLRDPSLNGLHHLTTSYRSEDVRKTAPCDNDPYLFKNRHKSIFDMYEFEALGGWEELKDTAEGLLRHLGFKDKRVDVDYDEACQLFNVKTIEHPEEQALFKKYGSIVFLNRFNRASGPFMNMLRDTADGSHYQKTDVLLFGMETLGTAARATNADYIREDFFSLAPGYAERLFELFGKERTLEELDEYLRLPVHIPRYGGGIGGARLRRAMHLAKLMPTSTGA